MKPVKMNGKLFRGVVIGVVLGVAVSVRAATEYKVSNLEELTNALNHASVVSGEAIVTLAAANYDLSAMVKMHSSAFLSVSNGVWARKVTIQGDPAVTRDQVVLDAGKKGRVLWIFGWSGSTTTLRNLTIRNGWSGGDSATSGGVITENWGKFVAENCVFEGNRAGIHSSAMGGSGDRYFTGCLFRRNVLGGTYGDGGVLSGSKDVVGCTFVDNGVYGDQVHGVCVYTDALVTNCVFDSNVNTGKWGFASAVAMTGGRVVDCVFTNNGFGASCSGGGALRIEGTVKVSACRFVKNGKGSVSGGAVSAEAEKSVNAEIANCTFDQNTVAGSNNGGAISGFKGLITNCVFTGNSAYYGGAVNSCTNVRGCVFACNYAFGTTREQNGGAGYNSWLFDCIVTNNVGKAMSGSFSKCRLYGCLVGLNMVEDSPNERTVEANDSYFEDCELFGLGKFGVGYANCGFNRCVLRDNIFTNGYGYFISGKIAITNSLLMRNSMYRMIHDAAPGYPNAIVNCSFVSNAYDVLIHHYSDATSGELVANNLFWGNGTRTWGVDDDVGEVHVSTIYSNNFISTSQPIKGEGNLNCKTDKTLKPRLMGDRDPAHPYAPRRKSILVGAGVVQDWMAGTVDLAGQERLTDGKVAIGAYETTDRGPFPGMMLILR